MSLDGYLIANAIFLSKCVTLPKVKKSEKLYSKLKRKPICVVFCFEAMLKLRLSWKEKPPQRSSRDILFVSDQTTPLAWIASNRQLQSKNWNIYICKMRNWRKTTQRCKVLIFLELRVAKSQGHGLQIWYITFPSAIRSSWLSQRLICQIVWVKKFTPWHISSEFCEKTGRSSVTWFVLKKAPLATQLQLSRIDCERHLGLNRLKLQDRRYGRCVLYKTFTMIVQDDDVPDHLRQTARKQIESSFASSSKPYAGMIRYFEEKRIASLNQ